MNCQNDVQNHMSVGTRYSHDVPFDCQHAYGHLFVMIVYRIYLFSKWWLPLKQTYVRTLDIALLKSIRWHFFIEHLCCCCCCLLAFLKAIKILKKKKKFKWVNTMKSRVMILKVTFLFWFSVYSDVIVSFSAVLRTCIIFYHRVK